MTRHWLSALAVAAFVALPGVAPAQEPRGAPLRPPRLVRFAPVAIEGLGSAEHPAGKVLLKLSIDRDGKVVTVTLEKGLEPKLDAAAATAAQRLEFEPALRDEQPVAATILFTYDFPPLSTVAPRKSAATPVAPEPEEVASAETPSSGSTDPASPPVVLPTSSAPQEVVVQGSSRADRVRESAQAVDVLDLEKDQRKSGDLGELVARARGVSVQRAGGLGSDVRFALNGLEGDQIRFFLDGVPLDYAGFAFGFANVPVNLIQRVEVYRGVVPTRFGADALGGAVDLVTDDHLRRAAAFSYQAGAFDTHRVTTQATALLPRGLFLRTNAFYDTTQNDYLVDVEVPDRFGKESPVRARRFHDGYRAKGVAVETGIANPGRTRQLSLRAHYADSEKQLQHSPTMAVPYGEVTQSTRATGSYLRYRDRFKRALALDSVGGYAFGRTAFLDVSRCVYNWFGQCVLARAVSGEIEPGGRDVVTTLHAAFVRASLEWRASPEHRLRLATAPEAVWRAVDERRRTTVSGVSATEGEQRLKTVVNGVEYQADVLDARLQNVVFGKSYSQAAGYVRRLPMERSERLSRTTQEWGAGDALRFRLRPELWAKASYEYATRLPRVDEVFGDGALTQANLALLPERSHNLNVGAAARLQSGWGSLRGELNLFYRDTRDLIRRTGAALYFSFQNVAHARTVGAEASARIASKQERAALDVAATILDARNRSSTGAYAAQRGDRIPNRPYAFGSATLSLTFPAVVAANDTLSSSWSSRYTHRFFRSWESLGAREGKATIPSQLVHTLSVVYEVRTPAALVASSFELQNVTGERTFDFFGVQRPGRAAFFKMLFQI